MSESRLLVLQNHPLATAGLIGEQADTAGIEQDLRRPLDGEALPDDAAGHDGLVVLGGAMSANDDAEFPGLTVERALIRRFMDAGKPVLGVCLGSQLMAQALGAGVHRNRVPEVGFSPIALTDAGAADPLFPEPPPPVMQWHDDTFEVPEGAALLASSEACRNQVFRAGRGQYGVQFHFEVTDAIVRQWVDANRETTAARFPAFYATADAEIARHAPAAETFGRALTDRWLAMVRREVS